MTLEARDEHLLCARIFCAVFPIIPVLVLVDSESLALAAMAHWHRRHGDVRVVTLPATDSVMPVIGTVLAPFKLHYY
jgi:hypothetical protein